MKFVNALMQTLLYATLYAAMPIRAVHEQESFLQANKLYAQKKYEQAYEAYDKVRNKGCATWYNMGNCAYQTKQYAQARTCWARSCKGAGPAELQDAEHNIEVLEATLGKQHEHTMLSRLMQLGEHIASYVELGFLQLLFVVIWLSAFFAAKRCKGKKRYGILVVLLLVNGVVSLPLIARYRSDSQRFGVIVKSHVVLYAGPNEQYQNVGNADEYAAVKVHEVRQQWCKIQCEKLVGWVPADTVVIV